MKGGKNGPTREFELLDYPEDGRNCCKYKGTKPSHAASKAFHRLSKDTNFVDNHNGQIYMVFKIRDTGNGKVYPYIGTMVKMDEPYIVKRGNKEFSVSSRPVIAKYDKNMEEVFTNVNV